MNLSTERFIYNYSRRIGLTLNNFLCKNDIYNSAYILTKENNKNLQLNIARVIWTEKTKQLANNLRFTQVPKDYEKKCTDCSEYKNQAEFKRKYDKIANFFFLNYRCNTCEYKYQTKWTMNKYYSNPEYREKRLQYQKEYRLRIKENNENTN
jgi:hypothetical protein